ncbi:MAG: T9SS type A sorting domain-containing protein [Hymenobacteraceae bacterium]|nr:T9SS type A sorting domain-containing protein [Hymenobacteraceae bacterium]
MTETADATTAPLLELWPNPAHGSVRLRGLAPANPVQLLDATGRTVLTVSTATEMADVSLVGLAPGIYTVRAGSATRRFGSRVSRASAAGCA